MSAEKIKDGGPIHPIPEVRDADGNGIMEGWHGMSLRDWFAGQALVGLISADDAITFATAARYAYQHSDAMLKAREAQS